MTHPRNNTEFTYGTFTGEAVVNPSTGRWSLVCTNPQGVTVSADNVTFGLVTQDIRAAVDAYWKEKRTGT